MRRTFLPMWSVHREAVRGQLLARRQTMSQSVTTLIREFGLSYISISMCLLFVLFLLAASRKSTNTGKYRLLKKRNPFYFSAYFFYFSAYFVYFSAYFLPVLFFLTFSIGVT